MTDAEQIKHRFNVLPTHAYLAECLTYQQRSGTFVWKRRPMSHFATEQWWSRFNKRFAGQPAGWLDADGYRRLRINGVKFLASRIAWMLVTGEDPGNREIDHKNTHRDDNRWSNLRLATHGQNQQNRKVLKNNLSGWKGVSRNYPGWRATIYIDRVRRHLGTFATPEKAHAAYLEAASRMHGTFMRK
jgi:hypothetical protein